MFKRHAEDVSNKRGIVIKLQQYLLLANAFWGYRYLEQMPYEVLTNYYQIVRDVTNEELLSNYSSIYS